MPGTLMKNAVFSCVVSTSAAQHYPGGSTKLNVQFELYCSRFCTIMMRGLDHSLNHYWHFCWGRQDATDKFLV